MVRPTLVSLARELGVSRQTVSNVLNAPHLVRPETRERVAKAIEESGYRPSAAAQALRRQRSLTLALRLYPSTDGINGAVMDRFLHSLVEQAETLGYRIMLFTAPHDTAEAETLIDLFERHTIDGCILTSTSAGDPRPARLQEAGVPFGAFGRPWGEEDAATHMWADIDGCVGTRLATQYLIDKGLGPVGFIGWPEGSGSGEDRRAGWHEAASAQPWFTDGLEEHVDDGVAQGVEAMSRLAARGVCAVVCTSDSLATGALDVLRRGDQTTLGHFVPVFGFDATPVARAIGLSSVAQPVDALAGALVCELISHLDKSVADRLNRDGRADTGFGEGHRLFAPTLEVRSSLAAPVTAEP